MSAAKAVAARQQCFCIWDGDRLQKACAAHELWRDKTGSSVVVNVPPQKRATSEVRELREAVLSARDKLAAGPGHSCQYGAAMVCGLCAFIAGLDAALARSKQSA